MSAAIQQAGSARQALHLVLDSAALGFIGILVALALLFPSRVPGWDKAVTALLTAGLLYIFVTKAIITRFAGFAGAMMQTAVVLALFSFLFSIVSRFQHVLIEGWMDEELLAWERVVTDTETTHLLERFVTPALTEWMMCSYVLYIVLLPTVSIVSYHSARGRATTDYLLNLLLANVLCYLGFILFPVAGPLCHEPVHYTIPLEGGLFTWLGEWIRSNAHYPGGCLPSPHCAATTVMIAVLYRYNRKLLVILLPVLVTIYPATVYGRYHYAGDSIAGILVAIAVLKLSPVLIRLAARGGSARRISGIKNIFVYNRFRKESVS